MKRKISLLMAILALLVFTAACSNKPVAVVNGDKISREDLDMEVTIRMGASGTGMQNVDKQAVRSKALQSMILETLALQEARARGLTVSDEEIDSQIPNLDKPDGRQELEKQLKDMNVTLKAYKKSIANRILIGKLADVLVPPGSVTDEDALNFYKSQPAMFVNGPGTEQPFNQVKEQIKKMLLQQKSDKAVMDLIMKKKASADIKINDQNQS